MNLPTIATQLQLLERQTQNLVDEIEKQIPENADPRTNRILEAYNRAGGAAAELSRAARVLEGIS